MTIKNPSREGDTTHVLPSNALASGARGPAGYPRLTRTRAVSLLLWIRFGGGMGDLRRFMGMDEMRDLNRRDFIVTRTERDGAVTACVRPMGFRFVDRRIAKEAKAKREALAT